MTSGLPLAMAVVTFASAIGLVAVTESPCAQRQDGLEKDVIDIAAALKKSDDAKAKKLASALAAVTKTAKFMELHRTRRAGGLGFGPVAGRNPATDGLEKKLREFDKGIPAAFANESDNYEEAGYWMAALAEVALAKGPEKKTAANVKAWEQWSTDMREASVAFAKASAAKDAKALKLAADKISGTCSNCHSKFKNK